MEQPGVLLIPGMVLTAGSPRSSTLPHRMETVVTESFVYLTWEVLGIWKGLIWVAGDCVALEEARVFKDVGSTPGPVTKRLAHLDEKK